MKNIYVVLSATRTIPARLVRKYTHTAYSHASISFHEDLSGLCSFSRTRIANPFVGGFVYESPETLMLGKSKSVRVKILKIPVADKEYQQAEKFIEQVRTDREGYLYNLLSFVAAPVGRYPQVYKSFICTSFVAKVLEKAEVLPEGMKRRSPRLIPADIEQTYYDCVVFEGNIDCYEPAMRKKNDMQSFFVHTGFFNETKCTVSYIMRLARRRRMMMKGL